MTLAQMDSLVAPDSITSCANMWKYIDLAGVFMTPLVRDFQDVQGGLTRCKIAWQLADGIVRSTVEAKGVEVGGESEMKGERVSDLLAVEEAPPALKIGGVKEEITTTIEAMQVRRKREMRAS